VAKYKTSVVVLSVISGWLFAVTSVQAAAQYQILHAFSGPDGAYPSGLILDASGNLYGTGAGGGANGFGTVFRLTLGSDGKWAEKVLYSFCARPNCADGANPEANLLLDADGNLYGTTYQGGDSGKVCNDHSCGTVFQLTPNSNGTWTENVLHSFKNTGGDGYFPRATLIFDAAGSLYGTTTVGGNSYAGVGGGTVFQLTPNTNGKWAEKVLYRFCSQTNCADGVSPIVGVTLGTDGILYGTTYSGGEYESGTIFQLTQGTNGTWTEVVLHSFKGGADDGAEPAAGLIFDAKGNLYTTTVFGGPAACSFNGDGCGTIVEMTPGADGTWTERLLYAFYKPRYPEAGLTLDGDGDIYGTTQMGGGALGCYGVGCGTAFQLALSANGTWTEKVLHGFGLHQNDGRLLFTGLALDAAGNLYGTTSEGGKYGVGTVFQFTP
jgi:uncharacterized repeat protein (TIGR03803 family)